MTRKEFTPTQIRILEILKDGKPHLRQVLMDALNDPLADRTHLNMHLYQLRRVLRPEGYDIICELCNRRISYRHVRLLNSHGE